MDAIDRFERWMKDHATEPDSYGWSMVRVFEGAGKLGYSVAEVKGKILDLQKWLIANSGNKKVNKKHWGRFIIKCLPDRRDYRNGRESPSVFTGESGVSDTPDV